MVDPAPSNVNHKHQQYIMDTSKNGNNYDPGIVLVHH